MGEGEGRVFDGSVPEGVTLRSGDVLRRPATPEEAARENERIAMTQAAADHMLGHQPEVSNATEADLKAENPGAIISADVPVDAAESVTPAEQPLIKDSDVPKV